MNKTDRAKEVEKAIELVYESLISHLPYTYGKIEGFAKKRGESHKFHQQCVKEYAEVISIISKLY